MGLGNVTSAGRSIQRRELTGRRCSGCRKEERTVCLTANASSPLRERRLYAVKWLAGRRQSARRLDVALVRSSAGDDDSASPYLRVTFVAWLKGNLEMKWRQAFVLAVPSEVRSVPHLFGVIIISTSPSICLADRHHSLHTVPTHAPVSGSTAPRRW